MNSAGYKIETKFNAESGIIDQTVESYGPDYNFDLRKDILHRVVNTQDAQIREALIKLGWTPPK